MELSTLHIKAPHEVHIGAKVMAAKRRTSMNQYVIDLIKHDLEKNEMPLADIRSGVELYRKAKPKQKTIINRAAKVVDELTELPGIEKASQVKCKGTHYISRKDCGKIGCPWAGIE